MTGTGVSYVAAFHGAIGAFVGYVAVGELLESVLYTPNARTPTTAMAATTSNRFIGFTYLPEEIIGHCQPLSAGCRPTKTGY